MIKIQSGRIQPAVMIMDCMGSHVMTNDTGEDATLLFIDLVPQANWAHDCLYVLIQKGHRVTKVRHCWPPGENTARDLAEI